MIQRYFTEPYRFIPPYPGTLWCRIAKRVVPRHLVRSMRVRRWQFHGIEHLRQSVDEGAGIVLAANHSRWADPVVLGRLGLELKLFFYYLVSYHLFKQGRLMGWWVNRLGGYSVWREGTDRQAIRTTARLLATAERPIVIFPEGTWFRQNDRLGPLQEGLTLMFRLAAKETERPLRVHPVAIKYWYLDDPRSVLRERLDRLEKRLGWRPQRELDLIARVEKLGTALLAVKEVEYLGQPQTGTLDERIVQLASAIVGGLEKFHFGREGDGWVLDRVRRLRLRLVKRLGEVRNNAEEVKRVRHNLDTLLFCENLSAHSLDYLRENPTLERQSETVQRIEETVYDDVEEAVGDLGAVVSVGPALDPRSFPDREDRQDAEPLMRQLAINLQSQLDQLLAQGPPPAWNCPSAHLSQPAASGSHNGA